MTLETNFHSKFNEIRKTNIEDKLYKSRPSVWEFCELLKSEDSRTFRQISKFANAILETVQ